MSSLLSIKNLTVNFDTPRGAMQAVRGVSLELSCGETLAIVGESGSGKSVVCKSIMQLLCEKSTCDGQILYNNEDLLQKNEKQIQELRGSQIAMVFQDPMTFLNPALSIGRQISETVRRHEKVSRKQAKQRAIELLAQVGISEPASRYNQHPHHFSGGMRQRAALAIALACRPKLLICDEITTALDVTVQEQILCLLKELQRQTGVSIIFVSHDLSLVGRIADRIAVMYAGKIVELGTVEEIFHDSRHPYTWGLLTALPQSALNSGSLSAIAGAPPDTVRLPKGDAFACRNPYALAIDYEQEPPSFQISKTHFAATWLADNRAPQIEPPVIITEGKIEVMKEVFNG